jgi:hypothetical protein
MTSSKNKVWQEMLRAEQNGAVGRAQDAATLAFDIEIDEQPMLASSTQLTERTDLPVSVLPRPEARHVPLWARLRLMWHKQIVRDLQH